VDSISNNDWEKFYSGNTLLSHIMCQLSYEQHGDALSIFRATGEVT